MASPSPFLSLLVSSCLVAESLAQILQDSYALPNYLVPGAGEQMLEAPYAVPNYVTLESFVWPSTSTWAALNTTLGGRLQALRPWAAVCYTEDPLYDPVKCKTVLSNYTNEHTVSLQVVSLSGSISYPLVSVKALHLHFSGRTGRAAATITVVR